MTDAHLDLLRLIHDGKAYWDAFNEWQAYRCIPTQLFRPERTFAVLERQGLVTLDRDTDMLRLTDKGRAAVTLFTAPPPAPSVRLH